MNEKTDGSEQRTLEPESELQIFLKKFDDLYAKVISIDNSTRNALATNAEIAKQIHELQMDHDKIFGSIDAISQVIQDQQREKEAWSQGGRAISTNAQVQSKPSERLIDRIKNSFPQDLRDMLTFTDEGSYIKAKFQKFVASDIFKDTIKIIKDLGGEYQAGKDAHFRIPKK